MSLKDNFAKQEKAVDRKVKGYERELIRNYQKALKQIRGKISLAYEKHGSSFAEMQKYDRLAKLEKEISQEIAKLTGKNALTLKKGIGDVYEDAYYRTAYILSNEVKTNLGFALLSKDAIEASLDNPLDRVGFLQRNRDNQQVLTRQLREQLTQGLIQGESYSKTAKRIKERMDIGAGKAVRIVQTESTRVRNKGKLDSMYVSRGAGMDLKKQWVATIDNRTRDSHEELDGQTFELEDQFEKGSGSKADAPGAFGIAAEDINCRCTIISIIEDFQPNKRRVRGVGETEYKSYKEFKGSLK